MLYELLKAIIKLALKVFYRKTEVTGLANIPQNGPLLVVSNHPNTLMDPLLVAAILKQQAYFLTKSSYFSTPFLKWLLQKLHMIPVYRAQDQKQAGKTAAETVEANRQVFSRCIEFLGEGGTLLIFPEGTSILERKLRDIKTGAARIAFGALAEGLSEIPILPIGLNYQDANRFRSNVTINIGAPILVSEFKNEFAAQPSAAVHQLTNLIRKRLEDLLIINNDEEEDSLNRQIESLYAEKLIQELNLPAADRQKTFKVKQQIAQAISHFTRHDPVRVRHIHQQITDYLQALKKLRVQDKQLVPANKSASNFMKLIAGLVYVALGFPVYLFGLLHNYIPYKIPGIAADKLTEDEEFEAPIMMVTGLFTFPVWYALCLYGFSYYTESTMVWALYGAFLPLTGFFALHFYKTVLSLRGRWQFLFLLSRKKQLVQELQAERARIITLLDDAREDYEKEMLQGN